MRKKVQAGDIISLTDTKQRSYLVSTDQSTDLFKGIGVIDPSMFVDKAYGSQVSIGNKHFWILPVSLTDALRALKRNAQIILPKDAAQIITNCDILPGKTVLEAGIGSGSLTVVLAAMVGEQGQVISYDLRQDFIDHAQKNLNQAGLSHRVKAQIADVTTGIAETDLDAVILDIPNPWDAIAHAYEALAPGGFLCSYSPLVSQMEQTVRAIKRFPFIDVRSIETMQREMIVGERGSRPSFSMLGHTGYCTFARKVLEKNDGEQD